MEDHNYFVPHRTDLIETYVSVVQFAVQKILISIFCTLILL